MIDYSFLPFSDRILGVDMEWTHIHRVWRDLLNLIEEINGFATEKPSAHGHKSIRLSRTSDEYSDLNDEIPPFVLIGDPAILILPLSDERCAIGVHKLAVGYQPGWWCPTWSSMDDDMEVFAYGRGVDPPRTSEEFYDGGTLFALPKSWSNSVREAIEEALRTKKEMNWPVDPITGETLAQASQKAVSMHFDQFYNKKSIEGYLKGALTAQRRKNIRLDEFSMGRESFTITVSRIFCMALFHQNIEVTEDIEQNEIELDQRMERILDFIEQNKDILKAHGATSIHHDDRHSLKKILSDKAATWQAFIDREKLTRIVVNGEKPIAHTNRTRHL